MKFVWLLLLIAAAQIGCDGNNGQSSTVDAAVAERAPNIILIVADDLGYTDLGAFGSEIDTPNLDALALAGLRLTNFHTSASCAPTRAMLMTGTDNHIAGMGSQSGLATPEQQQHRAYSNRLLPEVPTFVEGLRSAGYRTYIAGKWHLGSVVESLPSARGFDRSFALMEGGAGHFDDTPLFESYVKGHWLEDGQPAQLPKDFYSSNTLTDKLLEYIASTPEGQPFFGYLAFTAPHWPLQAPAEVIAKYRGVYDQGWDVLRDQRMAGARAAGVVPETAVAVDTEANLVLWEELTRDAQAQAQARMEVYAAMIDQLDQNVGRLMAALATRGDLQNTVVVFISDNGAEAHNMESPKRHGDWLANNFDNNLDNIGSATSYVVLQVGWARAAAAPFRASKSKVSEGGIRVPAFVNFPGAVPGVDNAYMRVMDLGPSLLELAGAESDSKMMGRSLLTRWQGGSEPYGEDEVIAYEVYGRRGAQQGPWKLLLQEPPYGTGDWQLYNLSQDLGEQEDLSLEHPNIRARLINEWTRYAQEVGVVNPEVLIRY